MDRDEIAEIWDPRLDTLVEAVRTTVNRSSEIRFQLAQAQKNNDIDLLLEAFIRLSRLEKGLQQRVRQAYRDAINEKTHSKLIER